MFYDRDEAGMMLADKLQSYKNTNAIVLAVPRGGVPVACAVAKSLNLPLQLVLTKKIGHPANPEYAIGATDPNNYFISAGINVPESYVREEVLRVQERLKALHRKCCGDKPALSLKNKIVIVVDDGVATGNTLSASINLIRKEKPSKIVVAVPVAPRAALNVLGETADEVISLLIPREFSGVGQFYENFSQVSDEKVSELLKHSYESGNVNREWAN